MNIQEPSVAKYARLWIVSHAEEVRAALKEAGVEAAIIIPEGIRRPQLSQFGFCAKMLIRTELSYRAIWSTARRSGYPRLSINAVRTFASRLRQWYGVPIPREWGGLD